MTTELAIAYQCLTAIDAARLIRSEPQATVFDVRNLASYRLGHVADAAHLSEDRLPAWLRRLTKDQPAVIHCYKGRLSRTYAQMFVDFRFSRVFSADGGYDPLAELMDGKLLLVTNTPDLSPQGVVDRYKSLADIERGFRVLKSEIEIGPVFHPLPARIKAHAALCFIALILYRVMRQRLSSAEALLSPERALEELQKLQHHQIRINQADRPVTGIRRLSDTQDRVFAALRLKKPTQPQQLSLL